MTRTHRTHRTLALAAFAAAFALPLAAQTAAPDTAMLRRADRARTMGNPAATVWVVEVSDFQCPYCRAWHDSSYAAIKKQYVDAGKVRLAYINFPLAMHKNALPAAQVAMCSAAQDKFWPMQDALFDSQAAWEHLQGSRAGVRFPGGEERRGREADARLHCVGRDERDDRRRH